MANILPCVQFANGNQPSGLLSCYIIQGDLNWFVGPVKLLRDDLKLVTQQHYAGRWKSRYEFREAATLYKLRNACFSVTHVC
jgi:hypothetical protein